MSRLIVYPQNTTTPILDITGYEDIVSTLACVNIQFERWEATAPLSPGAGQEETLSAYQADIDRLAVKSGYQSVDVVSMTPEHPQRESLRAKFLDEHTHAEDEIRFFVEGRGLFYLHIDEHIFGILCEKNDLISIPAGTRHWFDMGENPSFIAIRLFGNPDGWKAHFTGSAISSFFPLLGGDIIASGDPL